MEHIANALMWSQKKAKEMEELSKANTEERTYNCSICKDEHSGFIFFKENDNISVRKCKCLIKKQNLDRLEKSGLIRLANKCTFESYKVKEQFQKELKNKALEFLNQDEFCFFYVGGQVGCGKTHICTALTLKLIEQGKSARYVRYMEMIAEIKGLAIEIEEQTKLINRLSTIPVLYIDDLFKTKAGKNEGVTDSDVRNVFRILEYRYSNRLITIISSEKTSDDLIDIDEATGSRIREYSGEYFELNIGREKARNHRIYGN